MPYIVVMSLGGGLLALHAYESWQSRWWVAAGTDATLSAALLFLAVLMGMWRPQGEVPEWSRRFEAVGAAVSLRCNHCDGSVLPPAAAVTLPRLITYARLHYTTACQRNGPLRPGTETYRLDPGRRRRARERGLK